MELDAVPEHVELLTVAGEQGVLVNKDTSQHITMMLFTIFRPEQSRGSNP